MLMDIFVFDYVVSFKFFQQFFKKKLRLVVHLEGSESCVAQRKHQASGPLSYHSVYNSLWTFINFLFFRSSHRYTVGHTVNTYWGKNTKQLHRNNP